VLGSLSPVDRVRLSQGGKGEMQMRGDAMFAGYWQRAGATEETFTDEGWLRIGDLATLGSGGYLAINGLSQDVMIKGGENVFPQEIEGNIEEMEGISEPAVRGGPTDAGAKESLRWS